MPRPRLVHIWKEVKDQALVDPHIQNLITRLYHTQDLELREALVLETIVVLSKLHIELEQRLVAALARLPSHTAIKDTLS